MNIEKWDIEKIMQLPDWCFGRKFIVACEVRAYDDACVFDMSEIAIPERAVVWSIFFQPYNIAAPGDYFRLAVGEMLPTTEEEFMLMKPLLMGFGYPGPEPRKISAPSNNPPYVMNLRMPLIGVSRRLILVAYADATKTYWVRVAIVVSSIPKEVPDWLISGRAGHRW